MQAIILAAGKGNRLRPMTDEMPKCMVEVKGKPLLFNALDKLAETGKIESVLLVCGYMQHVIKSAIGDSYKGMKIEYINNTEYAVTNNVYSLFLVDNWVKQDCLLLECDLYYESDLIDTIINGNSDCDILVSLFNEKTMNGTVILAKDEKALSLVIKSHQNVNTDYSTAYKTVNVYKFKEQFFNGKLMPAIRTYIETGNLQSYYELVLGSLIYYRNDDIKIRIIDESRWYEIDDMDDLQRVNNAVL